MGKIGTVIAVLLATSMVATEAHAVCRIALVEQPESGAAGAEARSHLGTLAVSKSETESRWAFLSESERASAAPASLGVDMLLLIEYAPSTNDDETPYRIRVSGVEMEPLFDTIPSDDWNRERLLGFLDAAIATCDLADLGPAPDEVEQTASGGCSSDDECGSLEVCNALTQRCETTAAAPPSSENDDPVDATVGVDAPADATVPGETPVNPTGVPPVGTLPDATAGAAGTDQESDAEQDATAAITGSDKTSCRVSADCDPTEYCYDGVCQSGSTGAEAETETETESTSTSGEERDYCEGSYDCAADEYCYERKCLTRTGEPDDSTDAAIMSAVEDGPDETERTGARHSIQQLCRRDSDCEYGSCDAVRGYCVVTEEERDDLPARIKTDYHPLFGLGALAGSVDGYGAGGVYVGGVAVRGRRAGLTLYFEGVLADLNETGWARAGFGIGPTVILYDAPRHPSNFTILVDAMPYLDLHSLTDSGVADPPPLKVAANLSTGLSMAFGSFFIGANVLVRGPSAYFRLGWVSNKGLRPKP